MRFAMALVVLLGLWANPATADLYRWVDPDTGSVKFSSYPPPWYGNAAKQRRGPKVEVIPAGSDRVAKPEAVSAALEGARRLDELEAERKVLLQQLVRPGPERGAQVLQKQLETYSALAAQLDKLDPIGANARRAETQALIDRILKGEIR